jgi:streptogramin lyase
MVIIRRVLLSLAISALPMIAGCSSASTAPPPTPAPQRLYVSNDGGSGLVQIFVQPLSGASTPVVSFQDGIAGDVDDIAFDTSGRLYVGNFFSDRVDVFAPPFTNTSTSTFSVPAVNGVEGVDTDAAGNLYVASRGGPTVTIFNAPLSGTSTANVTITTGLTQPIGLKLDGTGKLYVADSGANYVAIYSPPFTNTSAPSVTVPVTNAWGISLDSTGNLWAVSRSLMQVQKFTPPFTNTSTPVLTISTGLLAPRYPALDQSGNLYVSDNSTAIRVFLAPLSATSAPAFSFTTPASNGIRFGP